MTSAARDPAEHAIGLTRLRALGVRLFMTQLGGEAWRAEFGVERVFTSAAAGEVLTRLADSGVTATRVVVVESDEGSFDARSVAGNATIIHSEPTMVRVAGRRSRRPARDRVSLRSDPHSCRRCDLRRRARRAAFALLLSQR